MRRSIVRMFTLLAVLSTRLGAQSSFSVGLAGTLGGQWQVEALELGLGRAVALGPVRHGAVLLRLGYFGDQAAILGGTRGFVSGAGLALRTGRVGVATVGDEINPTLIGLDLTLEGGGYLAARSPLPEGKRWGSVALLPALRVGQSGGSQFALLLGPAWFAGDVTRVHAFFGVRVDIPLGRRERGP